MSSNDLEVAINSAPSSSSQPSSQRQSVAQLDVGTAALSEKNSAGGVLGERESQGLLHARGSEAGPQYSFKHQFNALARKSAVVQKRQYKTNICQLLFPVFLLGVMAVLQLIVNNIIQSDYGKYTIETRNPVKYSPYLLFYDDDADSCQRPFPPRVDANLARFVVATPAGTEVGVGHYAANGTGSGLFGNMSVSDPYQPMDGALMFGTKRDFERGGINGQSWTCRGRPVIGNPLNFEYESSQTAADDHIYSSWETLGDQIVGGYSFYEANPATRDYSFAMYGNNSITDGKSYNAMLNLITRALFRTITPNYDSRASGLTLAGVMDFPQPQKEITFDLISLFGPFIYLFIFQLLLPVFMNNIVYEKEHKLREIMKMMGLKTHIYWLVTYIFCYLMYCVAMLLMVLIAVLLGFRYYTVNEPGTYLILLFLWGHTLVAMAFFFSVFFSKSQTATLVGYIYIIATGLLASALINEFFDDESTSEGVLFALQIVPSFALNRGLHGLTNGVAFGGTGVTMSMVRERWIGLADAYGYMVWEWAVLMLLAFYLDAVLPSAVGVKREPLFCLRKKFWCPSKTPQEQLAQNAEDIALTSGDEEYEKTMPDDLKKQLYLAKTNTDASVRILHLRKVFEKSGRLTHDVVAVRDLSMVINKSECFGFLGPNGAGKSTTINMLCGYTMPTSGAAFINKSNIAQEMDTVHMMMGVCPQENVLWENLTGGEHLSFYARLKGLTGETLEKAIVSGLRQVQLLEVRNKRAQEYSGGMKRRLCVAISLVGDPSIVLLDEPTTGLDPASRRSLWDVIREVKKKSCMLLTTHSMEEAEFLCDRLAIFDKGALQCVGTSADLKHRFERGYKFTLTTSDVRQVSNITAFVTSLSSSAVLLNSVSGTVNYELKKSDVKLSNIFRQMDIIKQQYKITDWGISNTTLEEVFVRIARGEYDNANAGNGDKPHANGDDHPQQHLEKSNTADMSV